MKISNYYDKDYFQKRDLLIPHLAEAIKDMMLKNHLQKVLDVGCGTGLLVKFMNTHRFRAIGCDASPEAVKEAKKTSGSRNIILSQASDLPFQSSSFDLVTSISLVEHLTQKEAIKFIKEAKRILKKNGFIFLVTPNFATPLRILSGGKWFAYQDPTHVNFFTPRSLSNLLVENGFKKPQTIFSIKYQKSLEWEFPGILGKLPKSVKKILVYLLFTTSFAVIRNSFWISAQKND